MSDVTNIVIAGLGGQGVVKASDILSEAVFRAGHDVKKSEVHGMSQRGGFVKSDVRFGKRVYSPMVPVGEADYLVVCEETQLDACRSMLREGGTLILASHLDPTKLPSPKTLNVAMMGLLSKHLQGVPESIWLEALKACMPPQFHEMNVKAFQVGRTA